MKPLPPLFWERLSRIVPPALFDEAKASFDLADVHSFRINPLKSNLEAIKSRFESAQIDFNPVSWYSDALVISEVARQNPLIDEFIKDGILYKQNLSSMLPALILGPQPGEYVL